MENSTCDCGSPARAGRRTRPVPGREFCFGSEWHMATPSRLLCGRVAGNALNQCHVILRSSSLLLAGGPYGFVVNNIKILPLGLVDVVARTQSYLSSAFTSVTRTYDLRQFHEFFRFVVANFVTLTLWRAKATAMSASSRRCIFQHNASILDNRESQAAFHC